MNDKERELIRFVVDGDIRKAQKQAQIILNGLTTEKDKRFKEYQLKRLANKGPELIELPPNMQNLLIAQDVSNFPESRFLLRKEEQLVVERLLNTRKAALKLQELGIHYTSSMLLTGVPGTGKTELARYIAHISDLPFVFAKLSGIVSSALGRTQNNIGQIFDYAKRVPCVLCLDEIDAIGMKRGNQNDVTEMSRVVIALMQELDNLPNNVILIGTTNRPDKLDPALFRRFSFQHEVLPLCHKDIENLVGKFNSAVGYPMSEAEFNDFCGEYKEGTPANTIISACTNRIIDKIVSEVSE